MKAKVTSAAVRRDHSATMWGELERVCRSIHHRLYERHDKAAAKQLLHRLEQIMENLPKNHSAILRAEGLALLHELRDQRAQALKYRKKEIELMEKLHRSVSKSVQDGDYDARFGDSILRKRDLTVLETRRTILRVLEGKKAPAINGSVTRHASQRSTRVSKP